MQHNCVLQFVVMWRSMSLNAIPILRRKHLQDVPLVERPKIIKIILYVSSLIYHFITSSKISASSDMNLICSLELHLMLRYGSNVIACSIINCGLICANEWSAVMQPTKRAIFDFSYSITKSTRPFTICWHERTSPGEISFFPLVSSFISLGSKTFSKNYISVILF